MKRITIAIMLAIATVAAAEPAADDKACAANDADACFRLATAAVQAKDEAAAAKHYAAACDAGHGLACVYMATSYETVEAKKARWLAKVQPALDKRCKAGDAEHCYYLIGDATRSYGQVCLHGVGGEANSFVDECQALTDALAFDAARAAP